MRTLVAFTVVFWCVLAQASDDQKKYEFAQAVQSGKVRLKEMVSWLRAELPQLKKEGGGNPIYFTEIYRTAWKRASLAEREQLVEILMAIPTKSLFYDECFGVYADGKIRELLMKLSRRRPRLTWEPPKYAMPAALVDAPKALRRAWITYASVLRPYDEKIHSVDRTEAVEKDLPDLSLELRKLVGQPRPEVWKRLVHYVWSGMCGNGSEMLYHPRNRGLLLSFLVDGMLKEAAGAALQQVRDDDFLGANDCDPTLAIDVLTAVGLDWEQVFLGSILPPSGSDERGRTIPFSSGEFDAWQLLATRGSERTVRECLELIRWAKLDIHSAGVFIDAALSSSEESDKRTEGGIIYPVRPVLIRLAPLSPELRHECLATYAEYLTPEHIPAELMAALDGVPSNGVQELSEPLAALLLLKVHPVAARAKDLLQKAGLVGADETIVASPPPLKFRLLLNGEPLNRGSVTVSLLETPKGAEKEDAATVYPYDGKEFTTKENGEVEYSLENYLAPERIHAVQFSAASLRGYFGGLTDMSDPTDFFTFQDGPENEWRGPWIDVRVGARAGDSATREVEVETTDLEVQVTPFAKFPPETPIKILLGRVHANVPLESERAAVVTVRGGASGYFQQLEPGQYRVLVKAPGAARKAPEVITIGKPRALYKTALEEGHEVHATVVQLDGQRSGLPEFGKMFRDGVEIASSNGGWLGLSAGKYTVRIPSTEEQAEEIAKMSYPAPKVNSKRRHKGQEFTFVIDENSPPTIDLGVIRLIPST